MKYSTCCDAEFFEPGFPDNDICSACGEHTGAWTDEKDECKHPKESHVYQPEEKDTNAKERYYCEDCDSDIITEPDIMNEVKDGRL